MPRRNPGIGRRLARPPGRNPGTGHRTRWGCGAESGYRPPPGAAAGPGSRASRPGHALAKRGNPGRRGAAAATNRRHFLPWSWRIFRTY